MDKSITPFTTWRKRAPARRVNPRIVESDRGVRVTPRRDKQIRWTMSRPCPAKDRERAHDRDDDGAC